VVLLPLLRGLLLCCVRCVWCSPCTLLCTAASQRQLRHVIQLPGWHGCCQQQRIQQAWRQRVAAADGHLE
jgi:hypothetical protein